MSPHPAYLQSKPRYEILDGLRGVAAIMVVGFHLFEAHSGGDHFIQVINHGYLAVDFFFLLSGFVIGYAYDDRWDRMGLWGFFQRRLVRLHPMVVLGSLVGGAAYYFGGGGELFPMISSMPVGKVIFVMLVGCTLLPLPPSMDLRGWGEMHSLNGPAWSLFFEYVANVLYAAFVRRFPRWLLGLLVGVCGAALVQFVLRNPMGDVVGGWSLDATQLRIGFTRMMFPFFAGLLLFRSGRLVRVNHAFWLCSLLVVVALAIPRLGGREHVWVNGLYEAVCIIVVFPLIVALGAGGHLHGRRSARICDLLGQISYPLYITHYPLIYVYTAWVVDRHLNLRQAYPVAILILFGSIALSYVYLRFYDEPVRAWLRRRWLQGT